jgi:lactate dehydrogenase (NAD+,ferredoxin) subunit LctB
MRITVCIKQVPGTSKVQVDEQTGVLIRSGIDTKMNPYDLYALETALRIKEAHGAEVHVISMGPLQASEVIREAFMMGADEGTLLTDRKFAGADCLATAYALAQAIQKVGLPDLVLCGKQTTDGDTAQVGSEMAEFLGLPHLTNVRRLREIRDDAIVAEMDLPNQIAVVEILLPCLITVEKDIYPPRLPSYRRKMSTRDRKVQVLALKDLDDQDETRYGLKGSPTRVIRIFPPEANTDNEIWQGSSRALTERLTDMLQAKKFIGD